MPDSYQEPLAFPNTKPAVECTYVMRLDLFFGESCVPKINIFRRILHSDLFHKAIRHYTYLFKFAYRITAQIIIHMHLILKYKGDIPNPRGGVRGVIPSKQNY